MAHSFTTTFKLTHLPASRKGIYWIINPSLPGPLRIALRLGIDLGGEAEPLDRDDWGEDLPPHSSLATYSPSSFSFLDCSTIFSWMWAGTSS